MINEFFLYREKSNKLDTPGILVYDNEIVCYTLEDVDRGLTDSMTRTEILQRKIYGITAIPYGRYPIVWYDSPKHGRVILLKRVKGFSYVEIHAGNWATQSLGCILPGLGRGINSVEDSRKAVEKINDLKMDHDIRFINIEKMK